MIGYFLLYAFLVLLGFYIIFLNLRYNKLHRRIYERFEEVSAPGEEGGEDLGGHEERREREPGP